MIDSAYIEPPAHGITAVNHNVAKPLLHVFVLQLLQHQGLLIAPIEVHVCDR